jgi:hypothetical protein
MSVEGRDIMVRELPTWIEGSGFVRNQSVALVPSEMVVA